MTVQAVGWLRVAGMAALVALIGSGSAMATEQPPSSPPAASSPGLAAFAAIPFVEDAALSPDGTTLAGIFGVDGERRICAMSLFDHAKTHCTLIPDGTEPWGLRWVNDTNFIVTLQALISLGMPFVTGPDRAYVYRMIAFNRDNGKIVKILWDLKGYDAADTVWVASDGSPMIEVAAQNSIFDGADYWPAVYRVNVESGRYDLVTAGRQGIIGWAADNTGKIRAGTGYNDGNRSFNLIYRGEQGNVWHSIERADTRKREDLLTPEIFLPGTDHALALHDDDKGHGALYEVDLTTLGDMRTVYAASDGRDAKGLWADDTGTVPLGVFESGAQGGVHWIDSALAQVQADFDKAVGSNLRARILSLSHDRKRMLVQVDRSDSPGALYFYDVDYGQLHRMAWFNNALQANPLSPVSLVHYKARDGLEIEAVLTLPKGRVSKDLPIVMLPHGGPWAYDGLDYDYWAQFVASLGYAVMQPNFRGSTGYGTAFERKGEGQMGLAMQDDISDGLAWAVAQGIADPKRACIMGGSYGGYTAMWGIEKDPDLYRCAIAIAGVSSLRREANDFGDYLMGNKYTDDWQRMTPDFAAVSPINGIARIKAPLLLIHGQKDVTVDFGQSKSMYNRMRAAGKQVDFLALPLADHHFGRQADREKLLEAVAGFLAQYNPANPAAGGAQKISTLASP